MLSAKLRELARLYSIQLRYTDASGTVQSAPAETVVSILEHRTGSADLDEALRARKREWWARGADPVLVAWGRAPLRADLRLPQTLSSGTVEWALELEDGSTREGRLELGPPLWADHQCRGYTVVVPEPLPLGYHTLRFTAGDRTFETFVIAAPEQAHAPEERSWGIFLPLYAAHTRRSWGAGDAGDMVEYRDWIREFGGGVVATLPMLAAFDDEPSPYSPVSRLFWNELYLDVTRLPEFDPADVDDGALAHVRGTRRVDHHAVRQLKRRVLERMAARFTPDDDFARFAAHAGDYAKFRAGREQRDSESYHLYVQYRLAQQMRALADATRKGGLGLYLDFPLGVNANGYDAWRYADSFAPGVSVGAPPDAFFTKGQNWGFPPLDPDALRERRYGYFRDALRHHVAHAGILRLDHVMGLHRLFWIPNGAEPKDGVYVRYPEEELYAIVTLESHRHRCVIVGEDLGTVPHYVPRMMARHGLRRMYVVQYELHPSREEEPAGTPPPASVASVNTHDMPSFAGYWAGRDIDDRVQQGLLTEKAARDEHASRAAIRASFTRFLRERELLDGGTPLDVLRATLAFLAESEAEIVLVNLEDLWLEREPQNVPGVPERSWRQRLALGLEEARHDADIRRMLSTVAERRREARGLLSADRQSSLRHFHSMKEPP